MAITDLYSKRQRKMRGEVPDVYSYDQLPQTLRGQILHIIQDMIGDVEFALDRFSHYSHAENSYLSIRDTLAREYGRFTLVAKQLNPKADFFEYFLGCESSEHALDCIEVAFQRGVYVGKNRDLTSKLKIEDAIAELNTRFREHGVGFQFEGNQIVRVDTQLLHNEAVKPTLLLLTDPTFSAAEQEFQKSHEHYRHGRNEEALADALKSLESTLKVICTKRGWAYKDNDTAKALLNVAFANGLVPDYLQSQFTALRSTIESGVPTVRNKQGGHGAGTVPRVVPEHLVSYVLHMTASAILFLVKSEEKLS